MTVRILVGWPIDESVDERSLFDEEEIAGGRWLRDVIRATLGGLGAEIKFIDPDPGNYWWADFSHEGVRYSLMWSHVYTCESVVHLYVRFSLVGWIRRNDRSEKADRVFQSLCAALEEDGRVGEFRTWKGRARSADAEEFERRSRTALNPTSTHPEKY